MFNNTISVMELVSLSDTEKQHKESIFRICLSKANLSSNRMF